MRTPTQSAKRRPIQLDLPADFIATIDSIAAQEMLSRSAWLRRTLNDAVRYARWRASLEQ